MLRAAYQPPKLVVAHHKSPINEYHYLAVNNGTRPPPAVVIYEGRQCYVSGTIRVLSGGKRGKSFHNRYNVHFLDDGSVQSIPAGKFNKNVLAAPLPGWV